MLIRSFLETAINPNYLHSQFHTALYNFHVLQDYSWSNPGMPPYFSEEFFSTIREASLSSDVSVMTARQWYYFLLNKEVLMETPFQDVNSPDQIQNKYTPCKSEIRNPDIDWTNTWRLSRLKGLDSSQTSFLWRLLHQILPTQEKLSKIHPNTSPLCRHCQDNMTENLSHALFYCDFNKHVSQALVDTLASCQAGNTIPHILTLNFSVEEEKELPVVWVTTNFLQKIWELRKEKKRCDLIRIRAELEAKVNLLRETKFSKSADIISQMLSSL